jgi:hypothetical protein
MDPAKIFPVSLVDIFWKQFLEFNQSCPSPTIGHPQIMQMDGILPLDTTIQMQLHGLQLCLKYSSGKL